MSWLRNLIYPSGKCHKQYGRFVGYSFASNILVSVESVLSVHSMLSAAPVADTGTIVTTNYIAKDIVGQIGGLLYMNKMGKKADKEPHKFLLYSNITQQTAFIAECMTPLFGVSYFIPIAGTANIAKNISFTGFGAINAKCIQKLALDDNTGEIYAKISVLNTIGSSIGMIVGLGIVARIPDHSTRLCLVPVLAVARIWTFQKAINGLLT